MQETATSTSPTATLTVTARQLPAPTPAPLAKPVNVPTGVLPTAAPTRTRTPLPSPTPHPTATLPPTRTPTPAPTPTWLPPLESASLRTEVLASSYLTDTCTYLSRRWAPGAASPDTVVVPIMFHSILKYGRNVSQPQDITSSMFQDFVAYAGWLGFETITTAELIDFLYHNASIPSRSMILILDDRRPGVVQDHFLPVLEANDWNLTLGWITADTTASVWDQMENLYASGRIDVQSHGAQHQYIVPETSAEDIYNELNVPISILEEHFGQRPLAFVWPGGNFTPASAEAAHQAGYKLAFTAYSRGPLLYNWIPLGEPERAIQDPLMVLPRYWSSAASVALDHALKVAADARAYAVENYPAEAAWFREACGGELPPLPESLLDE